MIRKLLLGIPILVVACAILLSTSPTTVSQAPSFSVTFVEYPQQIQPGGSYNVKVNVSKASDVILKNVNWELRVYFYSGSNCFSKGEWWSPSSGTNIYSGWYNDRYRGQGEYWGASPESRDFTIIAHVVDKPRPAADVSNGYTDIQEGSTVTLRARFIIKNVAHESATDNDFENNYTKVRLTIGDNTFTADMHIGSYGKRELDGCYLDQDSQYPDQWNLQWDKTVSGVTVAAAPGTSLPLIPIVGALVVLLVVVAVVVVVKKRGAAEVPLPPPSAPPTI